MAGNLLDLRTRILYETNKSGSDFTYGANNAIVTAIIHMEQKHPWVFAKTGQIIIPANTNVGSLPADFNQLLDAQFINGTGLWGSRQGFTIMSYDDLFNLFRNTNEEGFPRKYAVYGDQLYVYPYTNTAITININYNFTDAFYPANDTDTSVWFNNETIDAVRNKALEIFYRDTLQSPEIADTYVPIFMDYSNNLSRKNNKRLVFNKLSI
jgi:hypothetical protein